MLPILREPLALPGVQGLENHSLIQFHLLFGLLRVGGPVGPSCALWTRTGSRSNHSCLYTWLLVSPSPRRAAVCPACLLLRSQQLEAAQGPPWRWSALVVDLEPPRACDQACAGCLGDVGEWVEPIPQAAVGAGWPCAQSVPHGPEPVAGEALRPASKERPSQSRDRSGPEAQRCPAARSWTQVGTPRTGWSG